MLTFFVCSYLLLVENFVFCILKSQLRVGIDGSGFSYRGS